MEKNMAQIDWFGLIFLHFLDFSVLSVPLWLFS